MIPSPSHNRHRYNVKYFIRILVGLALTYIIGQLFQLTNAAPSRKYRLQKTTTNYGQNKRNFSRGLGFYLELVDNDDTTSISTLPISTSTWQPGQMKNCTEPGEYK